MNHKRSSKRLCWAKCMMLCVFVFMQVGSKAQTPVYGEPLINPLFEIDSQLREMFSPLCRPTPSCDFLFEMAAHSLDSITFTDNNPDTIDRGYWFLLYQEMRQMAYDPSGMLEHTEVFLNGSAHGA